MLIKSFFVTLTLQTEKKKGKEFKKNKKKTLSMTTNLIFVPFSIMMTFPWKNQLPNW